MRRHEHAYHNVTLVVRGAIEEIAVGEAFCGTAASVVIKPAGLKHANRVGPRGCRTFTIQFSDDFDPGIRYGWYFGGPVVRAAIELFNDSAAGDPFFAAQVDLALADLIEAARSDDHVVRCNGGRSVAIRARDLLHDCFPQPISSSEVATALNVHPVYLARAFRAQFAMTMSRYVRRLRARRAAELLAESDAAAASIAIDLGFSDQAHLCRVFREEFGATPGAFRNLAA